MQKSDNLTSHLSNEYDSKISNTIPYYNHFHEETINLIESMDIKPDIWLDTGCGTGTLVEKALQKFPDTTFILADPSVEMLNEARIKLSDCPKDKIEFLEHTASQDISIAAGIDVITAIQAHHYLNKDERYKAVKSCYDNLNENGVYVTFENIRPLTEQGTEIGKGYWKRFQISKGKAVEDAENHLKRFGVEYFPITIEEHLNLLRDCGFSVVEMFWYSYMQAGFYCIK
jgi:tRNA (cmo5U34)-methyltransferase